MSDASGKSEAQPRLVTSGGRPLLIAVLGTSHASAAALAHSVRQAGGIVATYGTACREVIEEVEENPPDAALIEIEVENAVDAVDCAHAMTARVKIVIVFLAGPIDPATRARINAVPRSRIVDKPVLTRG